MSSAASSSSSSTSSTSSTTSTTSEPLTEQVIEGKVDTTQTPARYLALIGRIRPLLIASTRYLAYTSDVGEAFRPVINPKVVTAGYGISIAYVVGDVAYEGYKGHLAAAGQPDEATVVGLQVARRAIFQGTASMLFPALTIHSSVKYSKRFVFSKFSSPRIRSVGPTAVGLAVIPFLPTLFDEPVEHAVEKSFDYFESEVLGRKIKYHTPAEKEAVEKGKGKGKEEL